MKIRKISSFAASALIAASIVPAGLGIGNASAKYGTGKNIVEHLDRGIYAVRSGNGMFVSWRWNADDADNAEFRLYRDGGLVYTSAAGKGATSYQDNGGSAGSKYRVDTVVNGEVVSSEECRFKSGTNYFDIPLDRPGAQYTPNDCCAGDVDGDGQYEIFLKWEGKALDNSQSGVTDNVFIDCITLDGRRLWRVDMGKNIRAGQHYTQMCVADFDCDGKAELITKTADGTKDGKGKVIGDGSKDYLPCTTRKCRLVGRQLRQPCRPLQQWYRIPRRRSSVSDIQPRILHPYDYICNRCSKQEAVRALDIRLQQQRLKSCRRSGQPQPYGRRC